MLHVVNDKFYQFSIYWINTRFWRIGTLSSNKNVGLKADRGEYLMSQATVHTAALDGWDTILNNRGSSYLKPPELVASVKVV